MNFLLAEVAAEVQPLISDTVGVAIVGGVVTVATAWVTIGLTNRHARSQVEDVAREARRTEARRLLTEFVTAGIAWAKANDLMVPIFYTEAKNHSFWVEWVDTDTGKKIRNDMETVTRAGAQLRLLIADGELLSEIVAAATLVQESKPLGALIQRDRSITGDFDRAREAFSYLRDVIAAFQRVEAKAAQYVAGELAKRR